MQTGIVKDQLATHMRRMSSNSEVEMINALKTDGGDRHFLKNTVFIVVIMCLMYNPLQNTKRFAFHILLQVQQFFLLFPLSLFTFLKSFQRDLFQ